MSKRRSGTSSEISPSDRARIMLRIKLASVGDSKIVKLFIYMSEVLNFCTHLLFTFILSIYCLLHEYFADE